MSGDPRWVQVLVWVLAALFLANGTVMAVNPEGWYWAIDGVPETGPFNQHFVRDIAFIYVTSGVAMLLGLQRPALRGGLWLVAAAWMASHAAFHVWEVLVGICSPSALLRDFAGVLLPGALTVVLCLWWWRQPAIAA